MTTATVNKIIPFSSVDGPGNRTAIFLQGCGFNCQYCHNPETIHTCIHCGTCVPYCKPGALTMVDGRVRYDITKCVLCDECFHHCPHGASPRTREMTPELAAAWTVPDRSAASRLERAVKRLPRAKKEALIARPERLGVWHPEIESMPVCPEHSD